MALVSERPRLPIKIAVTLDRSGSLLSLCEVKFIGVAFKWCSKDESSKNSIVSKVMQKMNLKYSASAVQDEEYADYQRYFFTI